MHMNEYTIWFVTGSQNLYGADTLRQVAQDSREIAQALDAADAIPVGVVFQPTVTTPDEVLALMRAANNDPACAGLIMWMHTFSPAKMWIAGLNALTKPFAHFHTQYNRDIPWDSIDMDFMNLNQSAHGGREFGFICSRMRKNRKVVVGHWQDPEAITELGVWTRAAVAWQDAQQMKIARFGDNMREVAVTDGCKVEAQIRLGYAVNGYGLGDLVAVVNQVSDAAIAGLVAEYGDCYTFDTDTAPGGAQHESVREAARIELGLRAFLTAGGFHGFTTTFENLHGLVQLPGLAVQRLMADGFGFGAEGDWKTAALLRSAKVMAEGLPGGTSFMEDYTYHLDPAGQKVLGSHMLEICSSIAAGKPSLQVHPLGIGGKADPARLVFNVPAGEAVNASLIDMGNRFRLVVNEVDTVVPDAVLPRLPVARALWIPRPNLKIGAAAWIYAGGAHHTVFSQAVLTPHFRDFAEMADIEFLLIDGRTDIHEFRKELRWNEVAYRTP